MCKTHGFSSGYPKRIYCIWLNMRNRTTNKNYVHYKYYGGKGISVCSEWNDFMCFYEWAINNGYQDNLEIDREDGDGNYCPSNCRWVTHTQNMQNIKKREDYGIYRKKNGFYVQLIVNGVVYCGGYSLDINKARDFKASLLDQIKQGIPVDIKRKQLKQDEDNGRFIWI